MLGKDEGCCASALIRTGQRDLMKEHAVHNTEALNGRRIKNVLFACAGCRRTATIERPRRDEGLQYIQFKTMPLSVHQREKTRKDKVRVQEANFKEIARNRQLQRRCGTGGGVKAGIPDLDTTIPENPYTKFQKQDVIVCDPTCSPT